MKEIKIAARKIGKGHPVFIIAEAGANWRLGKNSDRNYKHAIELINAAADAGADAVKFQIYRASKLYVTNAGYADYLGEKKSIYDIIHEMEIPYEWLQSLKTECDKRRIMFLATPFDEESADQLERLDMEAYKIASYTITHIPFLRYVAHFKKPILLSTGASELRDVDKAIDAIKKEGNNQIALLQCTAKYPAPLESINLRVIPKLQQKYNVPVGLSDHSREPNIGPCGAVALGACIIEKHFTSDNSLQGPDHKFAILINELKDLVKNIRMTEKALGDGNKSVQAEENELYQFCRRRIYALRDIKAGEKLSEENIGILRSGKAQRGLEPVEWVNVLGKKVVRPLRKNDPITKEILK